MVQHQAGAVAESALCSKIADDFAAKPADNAADPSKPANSRQLKDRRRPAL